jgi:hypothetical protein
MTNDPNSTPDPTEPFDVTVTFRGWHDFDAASAEFGVRMELDHIGIGSYTVDSVEPTEGNDARR